MDHPEPTSDQDHPADQPEQDQHWPRTCPECGTDLQQAVLDLDKTNADRPEMRPGEMVAVDFCPNAECPTHEVPGA